MTSFTPGHIIVVRNTATNPEDTIDEGRMYDVVVALSEYAKSQR